MLLSLIDKRGYRTAIGIIEAPAYERKASRGEVHDRRREIELAIEPGLHRVLVGGLHVVQVTRLQRADVARDYFLGEQIRLPLTDEVGYHSCAQNEHDDNGGSS